VKGGSFTHSFRAERAADVGWLVSKVKCNWLKHTDLLAGPSGENEAPKET